MKFLKNIFSSSPSHEEVSDYLAEMTEAFLNLGDKELSENQYPHKMLSLFTLINAAHSTHKILHFSPESKDSIGEVFLELRIYFECLWQLILLSQHEDKQEAISKLAGESSSITNKYLMSLFSKNKNLGDVFGVSIGREYDNALKSSIESYIFGERGEFFIESGDHIEDNITEVTSRIIRKSNMGHKAAKEVAGVVYHDTERAPSMSLIKNIDINSYKPLPDIFFK